ncbi:TIGR03750 family conjugal transfer protein [Methylomonas methanica]|uniref:Conjugative transfer region protein, TIGR03750 family n=1 Tax=Methylomonas methanica (strain DSM 25384 / MC09) TaxID=857087 RepID=G0A5A3_METMM|nr:TIGR03750 family conjugal transfer protein [Methylomonas methanica]AEG00433.1 conjugative transfer region protein, TIGR03750 family [Methylomonas methanica MC09]
MDDSGETLADRLNQEPVIFRGSTHSELGFILLLATLFWLPVSLLIAACLGAPAMGLGMAMVGVLVTIVFGSTWFQRIKRGRPDYYYQHRLMIGLHRLGLRKSRLILSSGVWDLGRTVSSSLIRTM